MSTQSATFTSNGSWLCPAGVTAVFFNGVGGGGGSPGAGAAAGGAGAGEMVLNMLCVVVPGNSYSVVIGAKGLGSAPSVLPTVGGVTTFNGFSTLGSGQYFLVNGRSNAAGGGGAGGGPRFQLGGGRDGRPKRESMCWTGGGSGGGNSGYQTTQPVIYNSNAASVCGGMSAVAGAGTNGGNPSGGTIFGATDGAPEDGGAASASPTSYGAGAGGTGQPTVGTVNGGDGCAGYVFLMWIA